MGKKELLTLALLASGALSWGAALQLESILGNSGEPNRPVKFGDTTNLRNVGIGTVYDAERGLLFERVGRKQLNAYTLDGRLYATYVLPGSASHLDAMVRAGDYLVMLLQNRLYRLKLGSAEGAAAEPIPGELKEPVALSASARDGKLAVLTKPGKLFLLDPASGKTEPFGDLGREIWCSGLDFDDRGDLYVMFDRSAHRVENGKLLQNELWPRRYIGDREGGADRARFLDGAWLGGAWHGTVKRFNREFEPAPGVVLGGGSGHFIGYVSCNYDAENSPGIALVKPGLFAISGMNGVIQLAEYQPQLKRLKLLRRIGAFPDGQTLAIDSSGRVLARQFIWNPGRDAQSPADGSVVFSGTGPAAYFDADTVLYPCNIYGGFGLALGKLDDRELVCGNAGALKLPENLVGLALYRAREDGTGEWNLLALGADGKATLSEVAQDRNSTWRKDLGEVKLITARPVSRYTGLTGAGPQKLYAAGDGRIIEFTRAGNNWQEVRRFGNDLGPELKIAWSNGKLAVSDPAKQRIRVLDEKGNQLASTRLETPGNLAFNGTTLVVHDPANQRLLKLKLEE